MGIRVGQPGAPCNAFQAQPGWPCAQCSSSLPSLSLSFPSSRFISSRRDEMHTGSNKADVVLDEDRVLTKWSDSNDVYLIVEQKRVAYWENLLTQRFHIYHQVTACGAYVVLSNRL